MAAERASDDARNSSKRDSERAFVFEVESAVKATSISAMATAGASVPRKARPESAASRTGWFVGNMS